MRRTVVGCMVVFCFSTPLLIELAWERASSRRGGGWVDGRRVEWGPSCSPCPQAMWPPVGAAGALVAARRTERDTFMRGGVSGACCGSCESCAGILDVFILLISSFHHRSFVALRMTILLGR